MRFVTALAVLLALFSGATAAVDGELASLEDLVLNLTKSQNSSSSLGRGQRSEVIDLSSPSTSSAARHPLLIKKELAEAQARRNDSSLIAKTKTVGEIKVEKDQSCSTFDDKTVAEADVRTEKVSVDKSQNAVEVATSKAATGDASSVAMREEDAVKGGYGKLSPSDLIHELAPGWYPSGLIAASWRQWD